ncbi:MAG: hypothetical protein IT329_15355 [Caldilineaceae bacterium]|nr:hypothetical protein [Caldilineaceae bacterium]
MATMTIDRLTLHVSGITDGDARRLAQRIAEELALTPTPRRARLGSLQVEVAAPEQGSVDELARQVANEVLRQVARLG